MILNNVFLIFICCMITFLSYSQENVDSSKYNLYPLYYNYLKSIPDVNFKEIILKGKTNENKVAITLDDGPNFNTRRTINFLINNNIPATFFVTTKKLNNYNADYYDNDLIEIALHGYEHDDFRKLSRQEIENDFRRSFEILNSFLLEVKYYRPPSVLLPII